MVNVNAGQPFKAWHRFMKIMRAESWSGGWPGRSVGANMRCGMNSSPRLPTGSRFNPLRRPRMQWQTPTATDFRFGFEITMYVAAR
jgi:coenzyme PQQ precursor peptide PqqA